MEFLFIPISLLITSFLMGRFLLGYRGKFLRAYVLTLVGAGTVMASLAIFLLK